MVTSESPRETAQEAAGSPGRASVRTAGALSVGELSPSRAGMEPGAQPAVPVPSQGLMGAAPSDPIVEEAEAQVTRQTSGESSAEVLEQFLLQSDLYAALELSLIHI